MASPEYSELQAKVTPSATILESMKHVTFNTEPYTALKSPLAEFAIWTLYESTDKQKFQEKLEKLVDLVINLPPPAKVYKGGWGPVVENDRQFVVLLGWESLEVCLSHYLYSVTAVLICRHRASTPTLLRAPKKSGI